MIFYAHMHGQNNDIYHIKKITQYVYWNLSKCIIFQVLYICISQKNQFLFIQICPLTNFETKVRYNTDNHGI
jgi:membrane-anchored glycerophosphoryl diester phosphodiesterase (GDPDase)